MKLSGLLLLTSIMFFQNLHACTGVSLKSNDNKYVSGRTIEFGIPLDLSLMIIPRNYSFQGTLPDNTAGLKYKSKYAVLGGGMFGENAVADGMNEKGLVVGSFYFPNYAKYAEVNEQNKNKGLSPTEFSNWLLTQFANIDEIKANIDNVVIVPTTPKGWSVLPPFHYVIYDLTGKSIVIEPLNSQLIIYDNPIGVMTNSPTFDWHLTNLGNYINLSPVNSPEMLIDHYKLKQFGQGSGLHGLPGDFTSPSRFIRAAIFSAYSISSANSEESVSQAFHILNQFDIPVGSVREIENKKTEYERTLMTTVKDPNNLRYYFKSYEDQNIKLIDMKKFDLNSKTIKRIIITEKQKFEDISGLAK